MALGLDRGADLAVAPTPQVSSVLTSRLARSMRLSAGAPVEVSMAGDTATLRGVVATPHDRELAEQLVRLEPGVARVTNELRVEQSGATVGKPQTLSSPPAPQPPATP
jgi:hypothetical protein